MHRSVPAWFVLIIVLVSLGSGFAIAQGPAQQPSQVQTPRQEPIVLSGPDVGFRLEGVDRMTGNPTGTLVVRIKGEWMPATSGIRVRPLSK